MKLNWAEGGGGKSFGWSDLCNSGGDFRAGGGELFRELEEGDGGESFWERWWWRLMAVVGGGVDSEKEVEQLARGEKREAQPSSPFLELGKGAAARIAE